jgi:hypothetical protein
MDRRSDIVVGRVSPIELILDADLNVETNNMPLSLVQTPPDCAPAFPGQPLHSVTGSGVDGGSWLRTMVGRTAPGAYLLGKLDRFKQRRRESNRRRITEKELRRLNRKIVSVACPLE